MDNNNAPFDSIHSNEQELKCCGYDDSDARRHVNDSNPVWRIEHQWCIHFIDSCQNAKILSKNNGQMTQSTKNKQSIHIVYSDVNSNPEIFDLLEATLTCPPCKDALVDKLGKILNTVGIVGLFFAPVQLVVGITAFLYWKHQRKLDSSFLRNTLVSQHVQLNES